MASNAKRRCRAIDSSQCKIHNIDAATNNDVVVAKTVDTAVGIIRGQQTRQMHGFQNEQRVIDLHKLTKASSYTAEWDAYTPSVHPVPVSIKTKKLGGDIELGDFFRNSHKTEDFYLHVSFWNGQKSHIVAEHILLIPGSVWASYFVDTFHADIKAVLAASTPDRSYDATWTENVKEINAKWKTTNSIIRLRAKRDHKKQCRMQCAISYNDFMDLANIYSVKDMLSAEDRIDS